MVDMSLNRYFHFFHIFGYFEIFGGNINFQAVWYIACFYFQFSQVISKDLTFSLPMFFLLLQEISAYFFL